MCLSLKQIFLHILGTETHFFIILIQPGYIFENDTQFTNYAFQVSVAKI